MSKHFYSIKYKILITVFSLFLLFVVLILSIWYHSLKTEAEHSAIENMRTQINMSNTTFENSLQDIINVAALTTVRSGNYLSTNIINIMSRKNLTDAELISYRRSAEDYLISLCNFKKNLSGLTLSDFSGNSVTYGVTTPYSMIVKNHYLDDLTSVKNGNIFIEPHFANQWYHSDSDLVFSVIRPVYDFDDRRIGFAIADVNCQLFNSSYDINPATQNSIYVIDEGSRKVIFTPAHNTLGLTREDTFDHDLLTKLSSDSGEFLYNYSGRQMLFVYNKSSLTGWTTICVVPEISILSSFVLAIRHLMIITFIVMILVLISVFLISNLLTKNIVYLTECVRNVQADNLDITIDIKSHDEVEVLTLQFSYMLSRIKQLIANIRHTEEEKRHAEIAALQFQMNPHFLYNSLNTIKFLASIQGIDNITDVSEKLSALMHTNMDGRSFISVKEDIDFIKAYITIQTYRHTSIFDYSINADEDILPYMIPKLIVQPIVENALKHGILTDAVGGRLDIVYKIYNNSLIVSVTDNGVGMTADKISEVMSSEKHTGAGHIGIHNINDRIHMYFGNYYGVNIKSELDTFTTFELSIPLITENEVSKYA